MATHKEGKGQQGRAICASISRVTSRCHSVDSKGADGIVERFSGRQGRCPLFFDAPEQRRSTGDHQMSDQNNNEPNGDDEQSGDEQSAPVSGVDTSVPPVGKGGLTPGQRLALKRGKKAQQKQDLRAELKRQEEEQTTREQEEAERFLGVGQASSLPPDPVQETASQFTGYVQGHRGTILAVVGGVLALGFGIILARNLASTGSAQQAKLLAEAVEVSNAQLDESDSDGKDPDGKPVFKNAEERASKASAAFAAAVKDDDDSLAADWARLGQGSVLIAAGKAGEADALFTSTLARRKEEPELNARALEGHAIALEAQDKGDEALKQFEELKKLENGAYKDLAEYHIGRLKLARGDRDGAKAILKPLYDRLNAPAEGSAKSRYLKGEVEVRLAEIDSSLVPAGSGEPQQQLTPEEIQRIIQQMQLKGGAGE